MYKAFCFWLLTILLVFSSQGLATSPQFAKNQILVKFKADTVSTLDMNILMDELHVLKLEHLQLVSTLKIVTVEKEELEKTLYKFRALPFVEYAEPNHFIYLRKNDDDDDDDDKDDPEWPFPFPPPGDGEFPWPIPWPPDDGDFPWPFPTPPGGGDQEDPKPLDPPAAFEPAPDTNLEKSWGIGKVGAPKAWKIHAGTKDIIVGVVDTGIDYNHEDLIHNLYRNPNEIPGNGIDDDQNGFVDDVFGWDFVHNDALPYDDHSHGTHVAGTIGATGNNGLGVSGVIQTVRIMGVKAFDSQGQGDDATAIKALEYAIQQGARVINNSWGDYAYSKALEDVILAAGEKGIVVVCAAGNESNNNDSKPLYPAGFNQPHVIAVAASTDEDGKAFFSNTGKESVHVAAPGTSIYSTMPENKYGEMDGTSMASPHVAGAAALILSFAPDLTPLKVRELLMETVDPLDAFKNKVISGGRINVHKALTKLKKN